MRAMPHPDVAVVIPTARRETRLAFALEALACQTIPGERFEVIVVRAADSGAQTEAPAGLAVKFLEAPAGSGPAEKRNLGWREAKAPLIAFTDDDCRPYPDWLERLLAAATDRDRPRLLQGRTEPDPEERPLLHGLAVTQNIPEASGWYETCNIAYSRDLLDRLGGFDEAFDGGADDLVIGGEDTDLGLRALAAGAEFEFVHDAVVRHAVHPRHLGRALRDTRRWRSVPAVLARHPEQRQRLHHGFFGRRAHVALLAVGLVVPLRRHPALALVATLPYLRHHVRSYPASPRGLVRAALDLPARALVDATEVAVTAREAVRHRVPVL